MEALRFSAVERCPLEIKYRILDMLPASDLRHLMQVSKALREPVSQRLYESVTYRVYGDDTLFISDLYLFKKAGRNNLSMVKKLTITTSGSVKNDRPIPGTIDINHQGYWKDSTARSDACRVFNELIISIVESMPQIKVLRCNHLLPISPWALSKIFAICPELETVHIRDVDPNQRHPRYRIPKKLKSIGYRGGYDLNQYYLTRDVLTPVIRKVIEKHADILEEIAVGQETWAAQQYRLNPQYLRGQSPWHLDETLGSLDISNKFPNLKKLQVISFNVRSENQPRLKSLNDIFNFSALRSFTLESCFGSEDLLSSLAKSEGAEAMNLKEFVIRHEEPGSGLVTAVEDFVSSFSGLELLSIMIDNTFYMPNHERIFKAHGSTLKVLVWDGRKPHRPLSTIPLEEKEADQSSFLECLPKYCGRLQELGIPLDTNIPYLKESMWNRVARGTPFGLLGLPHLTTLHVRVVPVVNRLNVDPFFVAHHNKAAVAKYLDWGSRHRSTYPNLKLVAIGQLNYLDRFLLDRPNRTRSRIGPSLPFFFDVTARKNMLGSYDHILQPIGKFEPRLDMFMSATVETIQEDYPNTRVFNSFWLK